jgi:hypothetical protein
VHPNLATGNSVTNFAFAPDSSRIFYTSDEIDTTKQDLFSVSTNLSTPTPSRISQTSTSPGTTITFKVSPDSTRVGYLMRKDTATISQVFLASVTGTGETLMSSATLQALDFAFIPDSTAVAFREKTGAGSKADLFYRAVGDLSATKVNGALPGGCTTGVSDFKFSPDSTTLVYVSCEGNGANNELFSVAAAGGTITRLSLGSPQTFTDIPIFYVTNDSAYVVYLADPDFDTMYRLYSVPIAGGTVNTLSPVPQSQTGSIFTFGIFLSPDSTKVFYVGDLWENDTWELYSNAIGPGTFSRVQIPPPSPREVFKNMSLTSDEKYLTIWSAGYDSSSANTVPFAVDLATGVRRRLVPEVDKTTNWRDLFMDFLYAPGAEKYLVKHFDQFTTNNKGLWAAGADGQNMTQIFPTPLDTTAEFNRYSCARLSPDGLYAAYSERHITNGTNIIRIASTDGSTNVSILLDLPITSDGFNTNVFNCADRFMFLPDSSKLLFFADYDQFWQFELWTINMDGTGRARVSQDISVVDGTVIEINAISQNSAHILYTADINGSACHLYATTPAGGPITQISSGSGAEACKVKASFTDDNQHTIYSYRIGGIDKLYANTPAGGQEVLLSNLTSSGQVIKSLWSLSNSSVLYAADEATTGVLDYFTVNIDGTNHRRISNGQVSFRGQNPQFEGTRRNFIDVSSTSPQRFFWFDTSSATSKEIMLTSLAPGEVITDATIISGYNDRVVVTTSNPNKIEKYSVYYLDLASDTQRLMTTSAAGGDRGTATAQGLFYFDGITVKRFPYPIP